jgi:P4 family phage/plasmid primase-like protien
MKTARPVPAERAVVVINLSNNIVPNNDAPVDGQSDASPPSDTSTPHIVTAVAPQVFDPVPPPEQDLQAWDAVAATATDGRMLADDEVALVRRVIARREAEEATWTRRQWDADFDRQFDGSDRVDHLLWELRRIPFFPAPADDQLRDALLALGSYTLPPPPEDQLDEDDDTVPPAPTLVARLAYLIDLGSDGPGYNARPISARRARIIRAAMEAANQQEQPTGQTMTPVNEPFESGGTAAAAITPEAHWNAAERAHELLEEAKKTGDPWRIYAARVLLIMLSDDEFAAFMVACKRAKRESRNGLDIDIALLRKLRRDRKASGRAWARSQPEAIPGVELATHQLAKLITDEAHFAVDAGRKLYLFSGGVYVSSGEAYIKRRAKAIMVASTKPDQWAKRKVEEVVEFITVDAPALWDAPPLDRINVLNGVLDVNTRRLEPHTPDFLSPVQIPVTYDPAACCPHWDEFVASSFPADTAAIAWEIPAWLITPDTSIQKAVLLTGDGANGKSTYLAAVLAFIGRRNASAVSLHKLEADRFSVSRLVGRLANVCPDLPSTDLTSTSVFKAITGGDAMVAERKFEQAFEFVPYARLLFSANFPPKSQDASPAFFRRWLVVPFEKTFVEGAPGTMSRGELDAMLADPAELSGVLNKALLALAAIRKHGFSDSESTRRAMDDFRQTTDPLAVWLDRNTLVHSGAFVAADHLFNLYCLDCVRKNRPLPTKTALGRALSHLRPTLDMKQRIVNGSKSWCYIGLGLLATAAE